jgi:hypothetical protein
MRSFGLLLGALLIAAPAAAQDSRPTVSLPPGDAATVRLTDRGDRGSVQRNAARWNAHDLAVARHLVGQPIPDAPVETAEPLPSDRMPPPSPVVPNQIRLRFHAIADRHVLLVVENGYDHPIVFRARMVRDGEERATDVCLVLPNRRGYEHWPHMMERLDLAGFTAAEWREGDPIPCH